MDWARHGFLSWNLCDLGRCRRKQTQLNVALHGIREAGDCRVEIGSAVEVRSPIDVEQKAKAFPGSSVESKSGSVGKVRLAIIRRQIRQGDIALRNIALDHFSRRIEQKSVPQVARNGLIPLAKFARDRFGYAAR